MFESPDAGIFCLLVDCHENKSRDLCSYIIDDQIKNQERWSFTAVKDNWIWFAEMLEYALITLLIVQSIQEQSLSSSKEICGIEK